VAFPLAGAIGLVWALAGYTAGFGVSMIVLGVRLRRRKWPESTTLPASGLLAR
jgi:hypothetical protein